VVVCERLSFSEGKVRFGGGEPRVVDTEGAQFVTSLFVLLYFWRTM
jgi:hypothetical protein